MYEIKEFDFKNENGRLCSSNEVSDYYEERVEAIINFLPWRDVGPFVWDISHVFELLNNYHTQSIYSSFWTFL